MSGSKLRNWKLAGYKLRRVGYKLRRVGYKLRRVGSANWNLRNYTGTYVIILF